MMEKHQIQLPQGLDKETAVEVLFQIGILMNQTEGSLGAPSARQMYQVEKFLDTKRAQALITAHVIAAHYARLQAKSFFACNTPEHLDELTTETELFFEECAADPNLERRNIFQRLMEQPQVYPRMCSDPLLRALSQEEWPPESMKNDASLPDELYNDDAALFAHWKWSFGYIAGCRAWCGRRLAKNSQGYLCNVDKHTQVGDRIAIVASCRMPFILRPVEKDRYKIVGHAYVLGLMYGEVMELGIEPRRIVLS